MDEEEVGKFVNMVRRSKELSHYMVGKESGLRPSIVKSIEEGEKAFTLRSLLKVFDVLGLELRVFYKPIEGEEEEEDNGNQ